MVRLPIFWVLVVAAPIVFLTALETVGDTFEIAVGLWYVSVPVLAVYGFFLWRWLGPLPAPGVQDYDPGDYSETEATAIAKSGKTPPGRRAPAPTAGDIVRHEIMRAIMTLAIIVVSVALLGLLIAFVMWAKWYLLFASPVYLGLGGMILWALWKDRQKAKAQARLKHPKVVRGAGPGDGSKMVR